MNYLSILSIFKNETMNMKIWLDHYLSQGVEHFYIIDNGSDDDPMSVLKDYIDKGYVTYYLRPERYQQCKHYREIFKIEKIQEKTKWLIVCDFDEFFYGTKNKLSTVLNSLEKYNVIYSNWLMFGSDGLITHPDDIRTAIVHREINFNIHTKYIFKTSSLKNINQIHVHNISNEKNIYYENEKIHLNHYPIQSLEFFQKVKMTRGDVANISVDNIRDMNYFNKYDINTVYCDNILKDIILHKPDNY